MKKFILNDNNITRNAVTWNTIATVVSSFQTMILMLVLSRAGDYVASSIIAIGYALASLSAALGRYGMRSFQVSDVKEKYSFYTYVNARNVTTIAMIIFVAGYVGYGVAFLDYSAEKVICVLLICAYRGIEAYEDVYHGRLQQLGRLDICTRILALRNIIYFLEVIIIYTLTGQLLVALAISVATSAVLFFWLNKMPPKGEYFTCEEGINWAAVKEQLLECFPVAAATFLIMYLGNAPKYTIDSVVSDAEQTYFNIIFMVVFAVNLFSSFAFNPILRKLALLWNDGQADKFRKNVLSLTGYIVGIVAAGMVFATIIGRRLLGWIYGVSLEDYKVELLLMLAAGGTLAIMNLMNLIFVLIRQQKQLLLLFSVASIVLVGLGKIVLLQGGILGIILLYVAVLLALDLILFGLLQRALNRSRAS